MDKDFERICKENLDLTDRETLNIVCSVNEENDVREHTKNKITINICNSLYEKVVDKVDDIDYGNIPRTEGDITKLSSYEDLCETINIIDQLLDSFNQTKDTTRILLDAKDNLEEYKDLFQKGFRYKVELVEITYSTLVLSLVSSISFLISSVIEFIKYPSRDDFDVSVDKVALIKTKDNLLFRNLKKFNDSCAKGEFKKSLEFILANYNDKTHNLLGGLEIGAVAGTVALVTIALSIIPILRELIFFFYYSRTNISDYLDTQSQLLQMNAYNVKSNKSFSAKDRERISKQQLNIAEKMKKLSQKIEVDVKSSEVNATKEMQKDQKKYKASEIMKSSPDASSNIFD